MANSMISNPSDNFTLVRSFETYTFTFGGRSLSASLKNGHSIPSDLYGLSKFCRGKRKKGKRR